MTFSMALSKTIILISDGSNFNSSCHAASLNREYFPKCGKKYMVLQDNNWWERLFFYTPAALLLSGSVEITVYHSEEGILWFQQNCWILDMPSSHLATSHCIRRMLLGTFSWVPMPGCSGWGCSWGIRGWTLPYCRIQHFFRRM